jgi:hypothetical protein
MTFFSFGKKRNITVAVIFDIGSASVGAALTLIRPDKKPHVVYHTRRYMVFQNEFDFDRFLASMLGALAHAARDVERHGLTRLTFPEGVSRRVDHILCSYASPWYLSEARSLTMRKEKPFVLTREVIHDLIAKQEAVLEKEGKEHYGGALDGHLDVIEKSVTGIKLNGYAVPDPYGRRATAAQFMLTVAAMPRELKRRVEDAIGRIFHLERITHHSFPVVGCAVAARYLKAPEVFLFIDVSGEVTDVALVTEDGLVELVSFPNGTHHLLRELTKTLGISSDEARSLLALYRAGAAGNNVRQGLERALSAAQSAWLENFARALGTWSAEMPLPGDVLLAASEWAGDVFGSFASGIPQAKGAVVRIIDASLLEPYVTFREKTDFDPFLGLAALYLHDDMRSAAAYPREGIAPR